MRYYRPVKVISSVGRPGTDGGVITITSDTEPTLRVDGTALVDGDIWWDETNNDLYIYISSAWKLTSTDITPLVTLSGVPEGSIDLGTFTGDVITDNIDVKTALQELENNADGVPQQISDAVLEGSKIVSPNGTEFILKVADDGTLSTEQL